MLLWECGSCVRMKKKHDDRTQVSIYKQIFLAAIIHPRARFVWQFAAMMPRSGTPPAFFLFHHTRARSGTPPSFFFDSSHAGKVLHPTIFFCMRVNPETATTQGER